MRAFAAAIFLFLLTCLPAACPAAGDKVYRVEVLQVTAIEELQEVYDGFLKELEKEGLVQGRNLQVKRTVIDFDLEASSWARKLKVYWAIKGEASRIASEKPDLVLTMGTPVTNIAKGKILSAGIPLLFTAVAQPVKVGCKSLTEPGAGFTGSTMHMDMKEALTLVHSALPETRTLGMVYSEFSGSSNHVEDALKEGPGEGFTFVTKKVGMKDHITPLLKELQASGVQAFVVPSDPYYGVRNYEAVKELIQFSRESKIPVVSFVLDRFHGSVMDVCVEFRTIGALAGSQAARILKEGAKPGSLPVARQTNLTVLANTKNADAMGIKLSPAFLQIARPAE
jgi:putative tryptophan/tyrosine transport system substrate-binding protein